MLRFRRPLTLVLVFASLTLLAAAASSGPTAALAATTCDRFASTSGSDAAAGTAASPFRTVSKLVTSLSAGQTGCLQPGTYAENLSIRSGGSPGAPITLTSASTRATLQGRLYIADSANDVVVSNLVLDGRNGQNLPMSVSGDRVSFLDNDVTNFNTTICFDVGSVIGYGAAYGVRIEGNRIHNCGVLPPQNHHHGIYVENMHDSVIRNNYIYDNADKGIVIFPDSDGNLIENNVIDGNSTGLHFGGSLLQDAWHPTYPKNNVARNNIITNSRRYNVEAYWEWAPPGDVNNWVRLNCVAGAGFGIQIQDPLQASQWGSGFGAADNLQADPLYVDRAAKDFRLRAGSPCAGKGPQTATPAGDSPPPPSPPSPSPSPPPASPPAQPAPTPPAASPPTNTVAPEISGQLKRRGRLTVSRGTWTGTSPFSFAYQWQSCDSAGSGCAAIAGATAAFYVVVDADIGRRLRAAVTASNQAGSATVVSAPTGVVPRNGSGAIREPSAASGSTAGTASTSSAKLGPTVSLLRPRVLSSRRLVLRAHARPGARVTFVVRGMRGRLLGVARTKADPAGRAQRTVTIPTLGSRRYLRISATVRVADSMRRAKLAVRLPHRARARVGA